MLYRTSLPRLIIARTIWSEWTRSQWSPWLEAGCLLSAQCEPANYRLLSWYHHCNSSVISKIFQPFAILGWSHSNLFNKDTHDLIYCAYIIASYSLLVIYFICACLLIINRSLVVHYSIIMLFHIQYSLFKRKRTILVLNHVQVFRSCWLFTIIKSSQ
jgi:hypothetical protein